MPEISAELRALCSLLATELRLRPSQVEASVQLLDEGATVPFSYSVS